MRFKKKNAVKPAMTTDYLSRPTGTLSINGEGKKKGPVRGSALVLAMLIMSLATVSAISLSTRSHIDIRRLTQILNADERDAYAQMAAVRAISVLLSAPQMQNTPNPANQAMPTNTSNIVSLNQDWAKPWDWEDKNGIKIHSQIIDLQSRFDINALRAAQAAPLPPPKFNHDASNNRHCQTDFWPITATTLYQFICTRKR